MVISLVKNGSVDHTISLNTSHAPKWPTPQHKKRIKKCENQKSDHTVAACYVKEFYDLAKNNCTWSYVMGFVGH